ncbi:(d)CMP kinase [Capillimicrobium parvum]|uniref:Cytidylate kinase n=1 Tax=Capillimicrobium parvum TaxID=2884022 RepID=A0A9E6XXB4_9ACTN|nr:(d)CMP kinase [Capillimicrobium parvum]UGS35798.1 Cytidylate kinase [Capillimicrobium parvum]
MIVAIDGPAGAGKSTVARAAARALGFQYLDTGAMYRAAGLAADPVSADIRLEDGRVLLDGRDVTADIRTNEAGERASVVAARPEVREAMVAKQRAIMAAGDWVAEGRDIGTVVAPDARLKVFLTASPRERARRRAAELGTDVATVLADQTLRDERDRTRAASPLQAAPDAVELDTTGLSIDEVVARIGALVPS